MPLHILHVLPVGFAGTCLVRSSRCTLPSASHASQVLHVLGHCVCDPPSGRLHFPMHSHDLQEHCGGQRPGHAPAAVLHPAGRLCHCQALHPPLGCVVSAPPCCHHHLWHHHLPTYAALGQLVIVQCILWQLLSFLAGPEGFCLLRCGESALYCVSAGL